MKYATTSGPDADALAGQARHRLSADEAAEREQALERYILDHISAEDPYLYRLYRATHTRLLRPRMASGHLQGQVLRMLTTMIQPRTVVEIGTFSGYSALSMAAGMASGSTIYTLEVNDEQADFTRPWLEGSPYPPHIRLIIGDVLTLLPTPDTVLPCWLSRSHRVVGGTALKSLRPPVRLKAPAFSPTNGRAITRPTSSSPVSISRAISQSRYSSGSGTTASFAAIWNTLSAEV